MRTHAATAPPAGLLASRSLIATAWTLVHVTVLTMSTTVHPRDRSLTGRDRPWRMGPMAIACVLCWTACAGVSPSQRTSMRPQHRQYIQTIT